MRCYIWDTTLAVFVLTHPDIDHCQGFSELLKQVSIGELWFAPRIFREYSADLSDDAKSFRKEAWRRIKVNIEKDDNVESGDRVRLIGYDDLLSEEDFEGFPDERLTIPGNAVAELDGKEFEDVFRSFIHAPFKADSAGERNDTSVAMQIFLNHERAEMRAMLFGDLGYPTLKRIFEETDEAENTQWNIMLAPHHCSKSAMYWQDEGENESSLKNDILRDFEKSACDAAYIIASSEPIPSRNEPGDNPPHAKAKNRYEEIVDDGHFICTQEYPDEENPTPVIFGWHNDEMIVPKLSSSGTRESIAGSISAARGKKEPPSTRVGFGNSND